MSLPVAPDPGSPIMTVQNDGYAFKPELLLGRRRNPHPMAVPRQDIMAAAGNVKETPHWRAKEPSIAARSGGMISSGDRGPALNTASKRSVSALLAPIKEWGEKAMSTEAKGRGCVTIEFVARLGMDSVWRNLAQMSSTLIAALVKLCCLILGLLGLRSRLGCEYIPQLSRETVVHKAVSSIVGDAAVAASVAGWSKAIELAVARHREGVADALNAALEEEGLLQFAAPNISNCLGCDGLLQAHRVHLRGPKAYFYPGFGKPGVPGTQFVKRCGDCKIEYDIEGYQRADTVGLSTGAKLPLPPEARHPIWCKVSNQTFIARSYTQMYESFLQYSAASIEGFVNASNATTLQDMGKSKSDLRQGARILMYQKRMTASILRDQLLELVGSLPVALRSNFNLKLPIDLLLKQAQPHRFRRQLDHALDHLRRTKLGAVVVDGNSSSMRPRCTCLNPAFSEHKADELGLVDEDAVFYKKYCTGTPVRGDNQGRCATCIKAALSPPADPSQRGPAVVQEYTQGIAATQGDDDLEQTDEAWLEAPDESLELSSLSRHLPSEVGLPPPIRRSQRIAQREAPANKRQRGVSSNVSVLPAVQEVAQLESQLEAGTHLETGIQLEAGTQPPPLRGYKRSARGTVYKAERICGEEVRGAKLWYHVAWEGYEERTWEPVQNIIDKGLIDEWKAICSQRKGEAWDLSEDVLMEEPIQVYKSGEEDMLQLQLDSAVSNLPEEEGHGGKDGRRTAGCCWAMCPDGLLLPGIEMADCESTRMTLLNIIRWFEGSSSYPESARGGFVFVYDDMCHLLRWGVYECAAALMYKSRQPNPDPDPKP
ncbi:hypothetical protein HaLaN_28060 [Haematococcus lacustris]|uniref:Chromo domain-containing protein n=1 Tax=Haematococcus lacustris TaxID=44745 RepID=A0A6A0AA28_HAELA|nr:hypothetical protein HaLaN_28060 [Haematococcus lacustris]